MKPSTQRSATRRVAHVLMLSCAIVAAAGANLAAQAQAQAQAGPPTPYQALPADQLDSLVASIALYPDPLLAQVMLAATYPQQIDDAAKWVAANGTAAVDNKPWDVSVKAVAHYPSVLNLLDSNLEWTAWLGAAYANQSTDLMDAVQHMRAVAQDNGNLATTPQQQVTTTNGNISVVPAQAQDIYVPVYDPAAVYYDSCIDVFCEPLVGFSVGYPIGPWLMYDWNWPARRIFYTGWQGGGWIARSRPFIGLSGVYVNERFRTVAFNHAVVPFSAANREAFSYAATSRGAFNYAATRTSGRMAAEARPFVSSAAGQRPFITRVPAPAARSASVPTNRGSPWGANSAVRPATPRYDARQAAPVYGSREAPRASYQAPQASYQAPRQSQYSARQSYAAPQQAASRQAAPPQRQAPSAPRGGSSGGGRTTASRGGHGR